MLAVLDFQDFAVIAGLIALLAGGSAFVTNRSEENPRLRRLEQKVDAILQHLGVQVSDSLANNGLTTDVRQLADQGKKIEAIKVHRAQTGAGLKEAKDAVEEYLAR